MLIKELIYKRYNYRKSLLNELRGNIFHFTTYESYIQIQEDGVLFNNKEERFPLNTSSEGSYGRLMGWICLLSLRNLSDKIIKESIMKYDFLDSRIIYNSHLINKYVYLILNPEYHDEIIQNDFARKNYVIDGQPTLYIPFVECWYPGNLPLEKIIKVLIVNYK